jgi:hypothetical protein
MRRSWQRTFLHSGPGVQTLRSLRFRGWRISASLRRPIYGVQVTGKAQSCLGLFAVPC